jgi:hypothetical protein
VSVSGTSPPAHVQIAPFHPMSSIIISSYRIAFPTMVAHIGNLITPIYEFLFESIACSEDGL